MVWIIAFLVVIGVIIVIEFSATQSFIGFVSTISEIVIFGITAAVGLATYGALFSKGTIYRNNIISFAEIMLLAAFLFTFGIILSNTNLALFNEGTFMYSIVPLVKGIGGICAILSLAIFIVNMIKAILFIILKQILDIVG